MTQNPRRQKFVHAYLQSGNATQAAIQAGYSPRTARVQGSTLLTNPAVKQAIEKARVRVSAHAEMTAVEVLKELATLALSDVRHYRMDPTDGHLTLAAGVPDQAMRCVRSVRMKTRIIPVKGGEPVIERECDFQLWSKDRALENLAKHFALLIERHDINLTQTHLSAVIELSDLALGEFLALMRAKKPELALKLIQGGQAD